MLNVLFLCLLFVQPAPEDASEALPAGAIKRLGSTYWRTTGPATSEMVFSKDGKTLYLFGGYEGKVRAMDVATGKERFRCETPDEQRLNGGALSGNGRWIITNGYRQDNDEERRVIEQGTHLFDAQTGKHIQTWKETTQSSLAISSDGSLVARCVYHAESGEHIHVRNIVSGQELFDWHEGKDSGVHSLHFSPDAQKLYVIKYRHENGKAMTLHVINVKTGKTETHRVLDRCKNITYQGVFLPDNALAYYDHPTRQIRVEELLTGAVRKLLPFSPGKKGTPIAFLKGGDDDNAPNVGLTFSPDGSLLAVAEGAHGGGRQDALQLLLYDTRTWQQKQSWTLVSRWIGHVAISSDNKTLAVGGSSNSIQLFETTSGKQVNEAVNQNPPGDIRGVCFSPDGQWLSLSGHDRTVDLWDTRTWTLTKRWQSPAQLTNAACFSPDGKMLVVGGFGSDLQLWEIPTGKEIRSIKTPGLMTISVAWLDNHTIAAGGHGQGALRLYDARDGKEIGQHQVDGSNNSYFSLNGLLWMNYARLIRTRTGELVAAIPITRELSIYQSGYSHQSILSVDARQMTTVYERATMQQRWRMKQPAIVSAFSPDGRWLACSHGWDQNAKPSPITIRDALTGVERCQLEGHTAVQRLTFTPDSRLLVSAGSDGTALIWQLPAVVAREKWLEDRARKDWETLAGSDAPQAAQAIARLIDTPDETIVFLKKVLPPVAKVPPEQLKGYIAQLADPRFAEREKAYQQLKALGSLAGPVLRESLESKLEAEPRRRVETLLAEIQTLQLTPAERQALRAVEIAERIHTSTAKDLLNTWANGAPGARLTQLAAEVVR